MPQAIPAVAAWVFNAVSAAGFSAATAAAAQAVVYATATAAVKIAAAAVISKVFAPKVKGLGSSGTQTSFKADPQAGMPFIIGRTGTGGWNVFGYVSGAKNQYRHWFNVFSGFGPVKAFEKFTANKITTTFNAGGAITSGGSFAGKMWMIAALGLQPAAALALPTDLATSGAMPEWTTAHKLSGKAADRWVLEYDTKVYAAGIPQPLRVVQGIRAYDPRLDSTYPGGSGAHRANDPATWGFSSYQNPYTVALTYLLGYWENGKRVGGVGVSPAMIDFPAFVEGANVADINGWRVGGEITSQDSKWAVLSNILQAGGGEPLKIGAKISCRVNMPRTSLATFTESGVAGAVQVPGVRSRRERKNSIIPRYRSEAHDWQIVAASAITATEYQTEDGGLRSKEVEYSLCQNEAQAGQLAGYDLVNAREIFPITITAKPAWMGYRPGDCITLNLPEMGLIAQKAIILNRDLDLATGTVSMTLTSETEGKHAFALGQTATPPATPGLTVPDFETVPAPAVGAFAASVGFVTSGSNALPAISITGVGDNPFAKEIVIEYRVVGTSEWIQWAKAPASTTAFTISGLDADQTYEIAISYISVLGVPGTRRLYGPYTTTGVSVSDAAITAAKIADGAITTTKFANGIAAPTIEAVLPTTGNYQGRLVILTTDNKLYRYTGSAFTAAVPAVDITGTLLSGQIADAAITVAKFASGISAPTIVATLPTTGNFEGRLVFLTTDGALYRYTGGAFTANVASANVTGVLTDAQLAAISATKITGQVVASQIADAAITVAKFASGISAPTIVATLPTTGNTAGRLVFLTTDSKLYRYNGSAFVATIPTADLTGQITAAQITANSITAAQIAANTITAGQIAAATITATQIAAGSITASKLFVGQSNMFMDSGTADTAWWSSSVNGHAAGYHGGNWAIYGPDGTSAAMSSAKYWGTNSESTSVSQVVSPIMGGAAGNTSYEVRLRAFNNSNRTFNAYIQFFDYGDNYLDGYFVATRAPGAGFADISAQVTSPSNSSYYRIYWNCEAGAAMTGSILVSNVIVRQAAEATLIVDGAIVASKIAANSIDASKIAANTITAAQIAAGTITADRLVAGSITANELAASSIIAGKIAAGAVSASEIAAGAITASKIGVVSESLIVDPNVQDVNSGWRNVSTAGNFLPDGSNPGWFAETNNAWPDVGTSHITLYSGQSGFNTSLRYHLYSNTTILPSTLRVTPGKIYSAEARVYNASNQTIYFAMEFISPPYTGVAGGNTVAVPPGSSGTFSIQAECPTGQVWARILIYNAGGSSPAYSGVCVASSFNFREANAASMYVDGTISANKIVANSITAGQIAAGAITAAQIAANTITAGQIAAGAISASEIASGAITTAKLAAGAVTANEIAANAINASKIQAGTITSVQIAAGSITATEIAVGTITANRIILNGITTDRLAQNAAVKPDKVVASSLVSVGPNSVTRNVTIEEPSWVFIAGYCNVLNTRSGTSRYALNAKLYCDSDEIQNLDVFVNDGDTYTIPLLSGISLSTPGEYTIHLDTSGSSNLKVDDRLMMPIIFRNTA